MNQKTHCKHPGVAALFALFTIFSTNAKPQPIGLLFVLDGSSANSPAQFIEQKTAFANVFAKIPVDSSIAIGVWQFSSKTKQEYAFRTINSPEDKQRLIEATSGMEHLNGQSALGDGIQTALDSVTEYGIGNLKYVDIVVTTAGSYDVGIDPNVAADAAVSAGVAAIYCYRSPRADCNFMRSGYVIGGDMVFSLIPANVVQMFPIHGKWDSRKSAPLVPITSDDGWSNQTMILDDGKDYWSYRGEVRRDSGKRIECNREDCPICNYGYCAHGIGTMGHDGSWGYTGSFVDGVMHGNGEYWSDFANYVGGFKHGKFHGYGLLHCVDVGTLEGIFTNGQFPGVVEDLTRMC